MTRTSIRRWTSAATILVGVAIGGVAIGGAVSIVIAGQAGSVLNLFATNSAAPRSTDLKSEAAIQDWGLPTAGSSGDNNFAQNAATSGNGSAIGSSAPPESMTLITIDTWLANTASREMTAAHNKHFQ